MVSKALFTSNSDEWTTPQDFFDIINKCYKFTLDAAATESNTKCPKFLTNGLLDKWKYEERIWCNPPYSNISKWVQKASESSAPSILLIPSRTDTKYWHEYIFPKASFVVFIKGRLKFGDSKNSAPFPSALVGYGFKENPLLSTLGKVVSLK